MTYREKYAEHPRYICAEHIHEVTCPISPSDCPYKQNVPGRVDTDICKECWDREIQEEKT